MKILTTLLFAALSPVASAAVIYIDDAAVDAITGLRNYDGTTITATSSTQLDQTMSGMALFTDLAGGVSYYRVAVSGAPGDTVNFGIQVAGPNGVSGATHTWLTNPITTRDIVLYDTGAGAITETIDLTTGPFGNSQPASVSSTPGVAGALFPNLSFNPTTNFDLVLIRAEFWAAGGGQNGNESKLFGAAVPEPSRAVLLAIGGLALVMTRRRR